MLLPSAIGCDASSQRSSDRNLRQYPAFFTSPPLSPPPSSSSSSNGPTTLPTISNIMSTCRVLQSMLTIPSQLPSPPTQHAEMPVQLLPAPSKLRLRTRKPMHIDTTGNVLEPSPMVARKRIAKRPSQPPRGINKRRRAALDDLGRHDLLSSSEEDEGVEDARTHESHRPSTPKRARIAPEQLPLGLERGDFHALHLQTMEHASSPSMNDASSRRRPMINNDVEEGSSADDRQPQDDNVDNDDDWSSEEDRILVELVLEKLKLSRSEWQDCARSLGRDRHAVGRRWRSLMAVGDVGLKRRRGNIHATWR